MKKINTEIKKFIKKLKSDEVEFYTRFQEEEWGCRHIGKGLFIYWIRNIMENRYEEKIIEENQAYEIFSIYKIEILNKNLVTKTKSNEKNTKKAVTLRN